METLISSPRNYLLDSELLNGSTFSFTSSSALVMAELNTLATLVRTSVENVTQVVTFTNFLAVDAFSARGASNLAMILAPDFTSLYSFCNQ